ncbi:hypothetical protein NDU88_005932 [Pleurodeles waltl]|uniref:Uncharacterized protein n=1 Tax=Pleurodeles waltl TaxID=8319 RepID=A0AAV7L413_PLEWA|nr:hypothetical protein NDU88_005932 [Pleurodeles waltl]
MQWAPRRALRRTVARRGGERRLCGGGAAVFSSVRGGSPVVLLGGGGCPLRAVARSCRYSPPRGADLLKGRYAHMPARALIRVALYMHDPSTCESLHAWLLYMQTLTCMAFIYADPYMHGPYARGSLHAWLLYMQTFYMHDS